ncbi:MAG: hypothetical protein LBQ90_02080 [Synergistaceae bacterium]|nr:hypothetical protein [Synergistaceae bacterium]
MESWRFVRDFDQMLSKQMGVNEQVPYRNKMRWFLKQIERSLDIANIQMLNLEGQVFDVGMAVHPLNSEEFDANDVLIVDRMIEPLLMGREGTVLKMGTVTLRRDQK